MTTAAENNSIRRYFQGVVVSNAMTKTIVVRVDQLRRHPKYKKYYRVSRKFKVHDEKGQYKPGDIVRFEECRPISKDKRWRVMPKTA